jgi:hypothetical protein
VEEAVAGRAFKNLDITYTDKHGSRMAVQYRPYLAVYLTMAHFHARMSRNGEIWAHDGFHGGEAFLVHDWTDPNAKMVLVQYEQASPVRTSK